MEHMNEVTPYIMEIASAVVAIAVIWITKSVTRYTGVKVEEKLRADLHSAIMSGVRASVSGGGLQKGRKVILSEVADHVKRSSPEAMRVLNPSAQVLTSLILGYVAEAARRAEPRKPRMGRATSKTHTNTEQEH